MGFHVAVQRYQRDGIERSDVRGALPEVRLELDVAVGPHGLEGHAVVGVPVQAAVLHAQLIAAGDEIAGAIHHRKDLVLRAAARAGHVGPEALDLDRHLAARQASARADSGRTRSRCRREVPRQARRPCPPIDVPERVARERVVQLARPVEADGLGPERSGGRPVRVRRALGHARTPVHDAWPAGDRGPACSWCVRRHPRRRLRGTRRPARSCWWSPPGTRSVRVPVWFDVPLRTVSVRPQACRAARPPRGRRSPERSASARRRRRRRRPDSPFVHGRGAHQRDERAQPRRTIHGVTLSPQLHADSFALA